LRLLEKLLIQGVVVTAVLVGIQFWLNGEKTYYMTYMPPLGFAFFLTISYIIQPLLIGILNVGVMQVLYKIKGWQVGFWLNGIFLLLAFSTLNIVMQTALSLPFVTVAVIDLAVFSFPFGCIARFSNGGWKKPIN
jgi:hypothetical protein